FRKTGPVLRCGLRNLLLRRGPSSIREPPLLDRRLPVVAPRVAAHPARAFRQVVVISKRPVLLPFLIVPVIEPLDQTAGPLDHPFAVVDATGAGRRPGRVERHQAHLPSITLRLPPGSAPAGPRRGGSRRASRAGGRRSPCRRGR